MNNRHDPRTILLFSMIAILALIALTAVFVLLRPALNRFSLDFYYPVLKLVRSMENAAMDKSLLTVDKSELAATVTYLQKQNSELKAENAAMQQLHTENARLRVIAGLNPPPQFRPVMAEVLTRDPSTWLESFTIDRGTDAGVQVGDLVIGTALTKDGKGYIAAVVGRIRDASKHAASVSTLLNPDCSLGVFLSESGTDGVLSGAELHGVKLARITCLPVDAKYAVGEIVVTSRFSKNFPSDIYLGTIAADQDGKPAVRVDRSKLSVEAVLKPALDLGRVHFVAVLTEKTAETTGETAP